MRRGLVLLCLLASLNQGAGQASPSQQQLQQQAETLLAASRIDEWRATLEQLAELAIANRNCPELESVVDPLRSVDPVKAARYLERCLALVPSSPESDLKLAAYYADAGLFSEARALYEQLLASAASVPGLYDAASRFFLRSGDIERAESLWQQSLEDPQPLAVASALMHGLAEIDRLLSAETYFRQAVALRSNPADTYFEWGFPILFNRWGSYPGGSGFARQSLAWLEKSVQLDPRRTRNLRALAQVQHHLGFTREAMVSYERGLQAGDHTVAEPLARLYLEQQQPQQAVAVLEKWGQERKQPPATVALRLGELYLSLPRPQLEAGRQHFQRGLTASPDNPELLMALSHLEILADRPEDARELYLKAARLNEDLQPEASFLEGLARLYLENLETAVYGRDLAFIRFLYQQLGGATQQDRLAMIERSFTSPMTLSPEQIHQRLLEATEALKSWTSQPEMPWLMEASAALMTGHEAWAMEAFAEAAQQAQWVPERSHLQLAKLLKEGHALALVTELAPYQAELARHQPDIQASLVSFSNKTALLLPALWPYLPQAMQQRIQQRFGLIEHHLKAALALQPTEEASAALYDFYGLHAHVPGLAEAMESLLPHCQRVCQVGDLRQVYRFQRYPAAGVQRKLQAWLPRLPARQAEIHYGLAVTALDAGEPEKALQELEKSFQLSSYLRRQAWDDPELVLLKYTEGFRRLF